MPILEVQKLFCFDAAASDAENPCLALLIFFEKFCSKFLEHLCKTKTVYLTTFHH